MARETTTIATLQTAQNASCLGVLLKRFLAWKQKRRDRGELRSLSNAMLRDLAIDRSEIDSLVVSGQHGRRRNRGD
ncbi:DUF1127 domain-containing protein [Roseibium porphyridii]|uniref:DUF1127 domain-containing protein n=1 Tax=Roseibium porphyridii TaxID=2866279 RepID=UPI003AB0F137